MRNSVRERKTKETNIRVDLDIDGKGATDIDTGIGFFDHMLTSFALHGGFDLAVKCAGDLAVDSHHTIEDVGIVLGQAFAEALGDKAGIARFGSSTLPMDEALASCHIDISGRACTVFDARFAGDSIGGFDTQMIPEFFRAFANNANVTLHLAVHYGENDHHKAEALFKAFSRALSMAAARSGSGPLSSKGVL